MLDTILREWTNCDYDFRRDSHPDDPLREHAEDWVPHYRLLAAVAQVLQPATILGVGDPHDHAAGALRHGNRAAQLTAIPQESNASASGEHGRERAIGPHAREPARRSDGDTRATNRFPGGVYDLVYVGVGGGPDGMYHDLEKAVNQARHILVAGYFATQEVFRSVNEFLFRHRDIVNGALTLPDSVGVLLIKVSESHVDRAKSLPETTDSSDCLAPFYDSHYFLNDCGGFASFRQTGGKRVDADGRLTAMLSLAFANQGSRLLDLGCGRGEIVYQAAKRGMQVTAVDYSSDAIKLARTCFQGEPELERRVEWVCGSAAELKLQGRYSTAVAGDLVEHMMPEELDRLYANLAEHLEPTALFIVHTFPNKWFYQYDYPRRRRTAARLGAYLPPQPRTRYEKLMHINEQSPRVLKRQLGRFFKHVLLWFATPEDPGGSLLRNYTRQELAGLRDLFAIASHTPIDTDRIANSFRMQPLSDAEACRVFLEVVDCPRQVVAGSKFNVTVRLRNGAHTVLSSAAPHPIHVSYHWVSESDRQMAVFDGQRTKLIAALPPGSVQDCEATVEAPQRPDAYQLQMRIVQELIRWHDQGADEAKQDCTISVNHAP